jgi:hypothetical protein
MLFLKPYLFVMGGLWAIGTIFGAAAGFDAQQAGFLNVIDVVVASMNLSGLVNERQEGQAQERFCPIRQI